MKKYFLALFLSVYPIFLLPSAENKGRVIHGRSELGRLKTEEAAQQEVKRFLVQFVGGEPSWNRSAQGLDTLIGEFESLKNRLKHATGKSLKAEKDRQDAKMRYKQRYSKQSQQAIKKAQEGMKRRVSAKLHQLLPALAEKYKSQATALGNDRETLLRMLQERDREIEKLTLRYFPQSPVVDQKVQFSPMHDSRLSGSSSVGSVEDRFSGTPPPDYVDEEDHQIGVDSPDSFGSSDSGSFAYPETFRFCPAEDSPPVLAAKNQSPHWAWAFIIIRMRGEIVKRDAELERIRLELQNTQNESSKMFAEIERLFVLKANELEEMRTELKRVTFELQSSRGQSQAFQQEIYGLRAQLGQAGRGVFSSVLSSVAAGVNRFF